MALQFVPGPVRVAVPATSANLGPGFDTLGLALSIYDRVSARIGHDGVHVAVTGEGASEVPADETHLVAATMLATFDVLGVGHPPGLELVCENAIPHARGLGSSSAAIVAGILLARALVDHGAATSTGAALDDAAALRLAADIEGHPDNVAPCLLGGFTIAWTGPRGAAAVRMEPAPGVRPVVLVPASRGLTATARAALPADVPHADAAFNAARAALLVYALTTDPDLLLEATEDRLHQDYRAPGMPDTAGLVRRLREQGAAAVVSGAGPSVLVLRAAAGAGERELEIPEGWCARSLSVPAVGGRILVRGHAEGDTVAAGLPS